MDNPEISGQVGQLTTLLFVANNDFLIIALA